MLSSLRSHSLDHPELPNSEDSHFVTREKLPPSNNHFEHLTLIFERRFTWIKRPSLITNFLLNFSIRHFRLYYIYSLFVIQTTFVIQSTFFISLHSLSIRLHPLLDMQAECIELREFEEKVRNRIIFAKLV